MSSDVFSAHKVSFSYRFSYEQSWRLTSSIKHENDILPECLAAPQTPHEDNQDSVQLLGVFRMGSVVVANVNIGC